MFTCTVKKQLDGSKRIQIPTSLPSGHTGALQPAIWEQELPTDFDSYQDILYGMSNGFKSVNFLGYQPAEQENYRSATCDENRSAVEQQIKKEVREGRYVIVHEKPTIISALGAVIKKEWWCSVNSRCLQARRKKLEFLCYHRK